MSIAAVATLIAIPPLLFLLGVYLFLKKKKDNSIQTWKQFLVWALFFAATQEFLNIVIIQKQIVNYFFSLLVFYPAYATICFLIYRRFIGFNSKNVKHHVFYILFIGLFGLQFDWFILGDAPWHGGALPAILISNIGIFFFYVTISFFSLMYTRKGKQFDSIRKQSLKIYIIFMLILFPLGFISGSAAYVIDLIGTTIFAIYYLQKMLREIT